MLGRKRVCGLFLLLVLFLESPPKIWWRFVFTGDRRKNRNLRSGDFASTAVVCLSHNKEIREQSQGPYKVLYTTKNIVSSLSAVASQRYRYIAIRIDSSSVSSINALRTAVLAPETDHSGFGWFVPKTGLHFVLPSKGCQHLHYRTPRTDKIDRSHLRSYSTSFRADIFV